MYRNPHCVYAKESGIGSGCWTRQMNPWPKLSAPSLNLPLEAVGSP